MTEYEAFLRQRGLDDVSLAFREAQMFNLLTRQTQITDEVEAARMARQSKPA